MKRAYQSDARNSLWKVHTLPNINATIQGEDNVLVLQTEVILRLVLKIHENDTNII